MNLVIDIGNTRTKAAIFDGSKMVSRYQFYDNNISISDIEKSQIESIKKIIVSSVRKDTEEILSVLPQHIPVMELTPKTKLPIKILYETPESLGKDRVALAVGANNQFKNQDVLIIDAGTCITYDFINTKNEYLGGAISPGLKIRFRSLHTFTEKLPLIEMKEDVKLIGTSTEKSILSGVMMGATAEIDKVIEMYRASYPNTKVILTGGDANYFVKTLKNNIFANSKILMFGLNTILNYNV